ncbi:MAG: signal peptide peptidase SppA [Bryobacteraceae bacterium]
MAKFLAGLVAGLLIAVLSLLVLAVVLARFAERPPEVARRSVLVVDLEGLIVEQPPVTIPLPFFEQRAPLTIVDLWKALRAASTDSRISAIMLAPGRVDAGWGKLQEIRNGLERLRGSGKPVHAFLRNPSTREYYLATAAGRISMPPEDLLDLKGLRAEVMYLRGTLDKIGVQVEIEHAGKYKDYGDMFTRTSMSPETREVLDSILDKVYASLVESISAGRKRNEAEVRAILDEGPFLSSRALKVGLVDDLRYEDEAFSELERTVGAGRLARIGVRDYIRAQGGGSESASSNRVAFVVGEGTITGHASSSLEGDAGLGAAAFIKLLRQVAEDRTIRGVIVRVDSPGGDSFASDEIWREMNRLSRGKPLVVSMSDEAASGGYYISMTGDPVIAYPNTFTGSIGVVFGKANLRGLYEKLGVRKELVTRGRYAAIDSDYVPLSEAARRKLREGVDDNYRAFVERVATARKRKFDEVEPLAQGRVWLGSQAKQNGLVDELGGLDRALELIRQRAQIPRGESVTLVPYPSRRSLLDRLFSRPAQARIPNWLQSFLARWPVESLSRGGFFRLMPYSIQVR